MRKSMLVRLIALLLMLSVFVASLSSCFFLSSVPNYFRGLNEDDIKTIENDGTTGKKDPDDSPDVDSDRLKYTLSQSDCDAFLNLLDECEDLVLNGTDAEEADVQAKLDEMEDAYYHIATQGQIAYFLYCLDTTNETYSDAYLDSSAIVSDLYAEYNEMCKRIDGVKTAPWKELFFRDWTEEELEEMRGYDSAVNAYKTRNDEILVSYRALEENEFDEKTCEYYEEFVANNKEIASLFGYDNYMEYAYEKVYDRDFSVEQAEVFRGYVKTYFVPLMDELYNSFMSAYSSLNFKKQSKVLEVMNETYKSNRLTAYLETYSEEAEKKMQSLFEKGNSYFSDSDKSYAGAFTVYLYEFEAPICYFGPGYDSLYTVLHEMGHYVSNLYNDGTSIPLDLAEVQSQGNEWIYNAYLCDTLDADVSNVIVTYELYASLANVLIGCMVDEFEQAVYEGDYGAEDYDALMVEICKDYGGYNWLAQNISDMVTYWKYVVLESPGYYISYAVSMVAVLDLYTVASENYADGQACYLQISIEYDPEESFLEALKSAGLHSPFATDTIYNLALAFEN